MKKYFILLLLLFAPFTIEAKDNIIFEAYSANSVWAEKFPEKFDWEYDIDNPSARSLGKEILKIMRNRSKAIDSFAYWIGERAGSFIPSGNFSLRKNGELDHEKTNVNIFDGDLLEIKLEEAKKKHYLFTYKLQPKINFGGKFGMELSLQKILWNIKFSLINEYKKDDNEPVYYFESALRISYSF